MFFLTNEFHPEIISAFMGVMNSRSRHQDDSSLSLFRRCKHPIYWLKLLLSLGVCVGCITPGQFGASRLNAADTTIYVMGDVPYQAEEYDKLRQDLQNMGSEGLFAVHVGDIKRGALPCSESIYKRVSEILKSSPIPVFSLPGDNEWNDCPRPDPAWKLWENYFLRLDQNWKSDLRTFRSMDREENFSIFSEGTLFIGVNLVGGRVQDAEEWRQRHRQNVNWVQSNLKRFGEECRAVVVFGHALPTARHLDFFGPFTEDIARLGKPTVYIHGDGHRWIQDQPFPNAPNLTRIQVDQGGIAPPLKITITEDPNEPFQFDRRLSAKSE